MKEVVQGGAYTVHDFMPNYLEMDPKNTFEQMVSLRMHPVDKEIEYSPRTPFVVPGSHPSLKYRGHELNRYILWAQTGTEKEMVKYGYTGWQYPIAKATVDVESVPALYDVTSRSSLGLGQRFNHFIYTLYKDGNDNIGAHHDKMKDIDESCWILVLKLGAVGDGSSSTLPTATPM